MGLIDTCRNCKEPYKGCHQKCKVGKTLGALAVKRQRDAIARHNKKDEYEIAGYERARSHRIRKGIGYDKNYR